MYIKIIAVSVAFLTPLMASTNLETKTNNVSKKEKLSFYIKNNS